MPHSYGSFCDDFYLNMRLGSQMALPHQRETVLHFFERIQKEIPSLVRFRKGESGEFTFEEERSNGAYRWVSLETRRLSSGHVNPESLTDAAKLHHLLLDLAPYHLGVSPVEIDHLDVLFGFDLSYNGNHDEVIAESLLADSPLSSLADEPGARPVDFQPTFTVSLSEDCRLQARVDIVTRTSSYQVRTGDYSNDMISVYLILRQYWGDQPRQLSKGLLDDMIERADSICTRHVVPRIVRPISGAIASRS